MDIQFYSHEYVDEHGEPVTRTKRTHPYSYDGFVQWDNRHLVRANGTVYSDRLYQWDSKKYNKLCEKYWGNQGQYFSGRSPEKIEDFLSDYFGHLVKLAMIMEYCNQDSGYPVWRFDYQEEQSNTNN